MFTCSLQDQQSVQIYGFRGKMSETTPSLERQASESLSIPERRIIVKDPTELPTTYSQTPGGTIFSTTPGGTRIIYDRRLLLQMRNSPLAKTPPVTLATIPDIINEEVPVSVPEKTKSPEPARANADVVEHHAESEVFSMD